MKKRILAMIMAMAMLTAAVAACNGEPSVEAETPTPPPATTDAGSEPTPPPVIEPEYNYTLDPGFDPDFEWIPKEIEPRHLGGMEVIVSDWWTDNNAEPAPAQTLRGEQMEDFIYYLEEEHGFTIKRVSTSGWGGYLELFTTSVMAEDPAADIFIMSTAWASQLMTQGLLYPLNELDSIDVFDPKWNRVITSAFTMDGNVYAITGEKFIEPRNFLFFNKRMFADAGIDPEEPYELQASGEWTWDKLLDYCQKLTRDTTGDGIIDTWAMTGFEVETTSGFVFSNYARYIGRNRDGTLYNAMSEPNFIEAVQFTKDLSDNGYWYDGQAEGLPWDWFITGFRDGHCAMIIREAYSTGTWAEMDDDWGMVFTPKGPRAAEYNTYFDENVYVLPFNISKERAEDIMYAFNMYNNPLPYDLENPDYWKEGGWGYQRFRDSRAVDDTLAMLYEGRGQLNFRSFIPSVDNWWGRTYDWGCIKGDETVIEKIEGAQPAIDAAIEEFNVKVRGG